MRPNKSINSGAHRSGAAGGKGKSRYFSTALPSPPPPEPEELMPLEVAESASHREPIGKYEGRASVGPQSHDDHESPIIDSVETGPDQWVDPLDDDAIDLTDITIDLRETMIDSPPDTYYQRHSSRVPGHQQP